MITAPLARLQGVTKQYGDEAPALAEIDLDVRAGEVLGMVGTNGSGKTTLLRILGGLADADGGRIECFGAPVPIVRSRELRRRVATATQDQALDPEMTGHETLEFFASLCAIAAKERNRRLAAVVETLDLGATLPKPIARLSGGQRQRLHVALAILQQPDLLLLDEPSNGLDPDSRLALTRTLKQYAGTERAVVVSTHDLRSAEDAFDRLAVLSGGRIIAIDRPDKLRAEYARPRVEIMFTSGAQLPASLEKEIRSHATVGSAGLRGGVMQVRLAEIATASTPLRDFIRTKKLAIDEIREHAPTLEEAFIGLTGEQLPQTQSDALDRRGRKRAKAATA